VYIFEHHVWVNPEIFRQINKLIGKINSNYFNCAIIHLSSPRHQGASSNGSRLWEWSRLAQKRRAKVSSSTSYSRMWPMPRCPWHADCGRRASEHPHSQSSCCCPMVETGSGIGLRRNSPEFGLQPNARSCAPVAPPWSQQAGRRRFYHASGVSLGAASWEPRHYGPGCTAVAVPQRVSRRRHSYGEHHESIFRVVNSLQPSVMPGGR
jgi:hypothetical protein